MRLFKNLLVVGTIIIYFFVNSTSCTFDSEEELLEYYNCDTVNVNYNNLTYIFTDICAVCHDDDPPRVGIKMNSYENVKASINTGKVLPAIKHTGPYKMPYGQPMLSDCDIDKIEAWINAGMPEN
ncbi:MAG TPA: hypothetical protein DCG75_15325 [Bacteroidales bacterium]|jgi:hypothetical protein|nr:hypothetical protein [Bacteroidales bacterium]